MSNEDFLIKESINPGSMVLANGNKHRRSGYLILRISADLIIMGSMFLISSLRLPGSSPTTGLWTFDFGLWTLNFEL